MKSESAAIRDDAVCGGCSSGSRADSLEFVKDIHASGDLAEDDVLAVEMGGGSEAHEELRAVGVGTSVGHGEDASASVSVGEVLVLELATEDGLATAAIASGEIATLGHEAGDNTMELAALEVEVLALGAHALFASAEALEVLSGLGGVLGIESHLNSAGCLATDSDIEEYFAHCEVWLSFQEISL